MSLPSIDVSQTWGEVLQKNVNRLNFEFQVYSRRKLHHKTQDPTIIPAQDQSNTSGDGHLNISSTLNPPIS